jgi:hypothetical protein
MAENERGLAGRLPAALFPAPLRPMFDDAWSIAVAGYVLAILVYLGGFWLGVLTENHNHQGFRDFLAQLVSHHFEVIAPAVLLAVAVVALSPSASTRATSRSTMLIDAGLIGMLLIALIVVLGDLLGVIIDLSYASRGFAAFIEEFSIHIGALIVGAVAGLWTLAQLNARRPGAG